jgi:AcrR family transcriptional regulator
MTMKQTADNPSRHETRKLRTRQQLLEAAKATFSQHGYHNTSVQNITDAANLGKRTFYLHFDDKEAILDELARRSVGEIEARIQTLKGDDTPMREALQTVLGTVFAWISAHQMLARILMGREGTAEVTARLREYVAAAFAEGMCHLCPAPDGPIPCEMLAQVITGMVLQLAAWWLDNPASYDAEAMTGMAMAVLFESIESFVSEEETQCD